MVIFIVNVNKNEMKKKRFGIVNKREIVCPQFTKGRPWIARLWASRLTIIIALDLKQGMRLMKLGSGPRCGVGNMRYNFVCKKLIYRVKTRIYIFV